MKRVGFLYEKIYDIENIMEAIKNASRHKHKKKAVKVVLSNPAYYAKQIQKMLMNQKVEWGTDRYMQIYEPSSKKYREVTIPSFYPDQIIHWAIMQVIKPQIEKGMTYSCIGSVPKRGPLCGKKRIERMLEKDKKIKYCYKADIKHFFQNISVRKMKELLREDFKDNKLLCLLDDILDRGSRNAGKGLAIGYYTSQWLSNYYLQKVDHFILENIKPKHYIRYVDDIFMADSSKRKLHKANKMLSNFLKKERYECNIKPNWSVFRLHSRPIDFLGYKFYKGYTRLRNRIFFHLMRCVRRFNKQIKKHERTFRSVLSLLGFLIHVNCGKSVYEKYIKPNASKGYIIRLIKGEQL